MTRHLRGFSLIEMLVLLLLVAAGIATVVAPMSLNASRKAQAMGFVDAVFALQENLRTAHASREGYEGLTGAMANERGWMPPALRVTSTRAMTPWGAPLLLQPGSIMNPPGVTQDAFIVRTSFYNARVCADVVTKLAAHAGYIRVGSFHLRHGRLGVSGNRLTHGEVVLGVGLVCKGASKTYPVEMFYANV